MEEKRRGLKKFLKKNVRSEIKNEKDMMSKRMMREKIEMKMRKI